VPQRLLDSASLGRAHRCLRGGKSIILSAFFGAICMHTKLVVIDLVDVVEASPGNTK
jgi:hypothetical protein